MVDASCILNCMLYVTQAQSRCRGEFVWSGIYCETSSEMQKTRESWAALAQAAHICIYLNRSLVILVILVALGLNKEMLLILLFSLNLHLLRLYAAAP